MCIFLKRCSHAWMWRAISNTLHGGFCELAVEDGKAIDRSLKLAKWSHKDADATSSALVCDARSRAFTRTALRLRQKDSVRERVAIDASFGSRFVQEEKVAADGAHPIE